MIRSALCAIISVCALLFTPEASASKASEQFLECCNRKEGIEKFCKQNMCSFDLIPSQIFIGYQNCLLTADNSIGKVWDCATSGHDHTNCCQRRGVPAHCLSLCNGKVTNYQLNPACVIYFDPIMGCFKEHYDQRN